MGIFGWDYPPGCNSVPGDEPCICEICGLTDDACVCPECPECGEAGNPECYHKHGMVLTESQKAVANLSEFMARHDGEGEYMQYEIATCRDIIESLLEIVRPHGLDDPEAEIVKRARNYLKG